MDILDRPENSSWTEDAVLSVKKILSYHDQLSDLGKTMKIIGTGAPDDLKIGKMEDLLKTL